MKRKQLLIASASLLLLLVNTAAAQTTAFTYQGKLTDSGNLANGNYDFQFKLFDTQTVGTGTQIGLLVPVSNVTVSNGIFTVQLDFGVCAACFDGSARFLEISVKLTSGSTFTTLGPRQPITSTPYAINAAQLGGLAASSFLQNSTSQQVSSNFNISGDGTAGGNLSAGGTMAANIVNATTRYNLNGQTVLSAAGSNNLFAGINAGTTGSNNAFFGAFAGNGNTTGINNAFFGTNAGQANTGASQNAFFGARAGQANTTGCCNAFFGFQAGLTNTTGVHNTFIGSGADFFLANSTGDNNTLVGANSAVLTGGVGINNATAIGYQAQVSASNSLVLGGITGVNGGTDTNVGIGVTAPTARLHVNGNGLFSGNLTVNGTLTASLPAGSANYIQNGTSPQAASNFNISGTGTANILSATTQYNLGGNRILSAVGSFNLFAGINAGINNAGTDNAFFGSFAGQANTDGFDNSFFGSRAGLSNTLGFGNAFFGARAGRFNTANNNAFFGSSAGQSNTSGQDNAFFGAFAGSSNNGFSNAFFGAHAGQANTTGFSNAFFGEQAGQANTTGTDNAFFGTVAGGSNTIGGSNSFFGTQAGFFNTTGQNNTFIGDGADFTFNNSTGGNNTLLGASSRVTSGISNATAIGASASVTQSDSLVLGSSTVKVGIGTTAPDVILDVQRDGGTIPETARFTTYGTGNEILSRASGGTRAMPTATLNSTNLLVLGATGHNGTSFVDFPAASINLDVAEAWTPTAQGTQIRFRTTPNGSAANNTNTATRMIVTNDGNVGIGTTAPADLLHVNGILRIQTLGGAGSTSLCRNASNQIATCSSSLRYKTAIQSFTSGLEIVNRLHPISFTWKQGGMRDLGFAAEEVAKVEPLFTFTNEKGEVEGVKYDRLSVVLVNAVKELQDENGTLKQRLTEQQARTSMQRQQLNQQQAQLARQEQQLSQQQQQITQQQQEMTAIKRLLCASQPQADFCKTKSLK